jgi:hypothetical protein
MAKDGWSLAVIIDRGRAFDFLSWYRPLTVAEAIAEKPQLESLRQELLWKLNSPGTCTKTHLKRMECEKIGGSQSTRESSALVSRHEMKAQ